MAFGGSCDDMLSPAEAESALGAPAVNQSAQDLAAADSGVWDSPPPPAAEGTAGGLECTWSIVDAPAVNRPSVTLLALPMTEVDPATADALTEVQCEPRYDESICRLAVESEDVWLMARMAERHDGAQATMQAALAAAVDNAADIATPVAAAPTAQRWPIVQCEQLAERMQLGDVLGDDFWSGYWEGNRQREDDLFEYAGVHQLCEFGSGERASEHYIVTVTLAPDSAWRWDGLAAVGGDAVAVAGADDALRFTFEGDGGYIADQIRATDGTNLVTVSVSGGAIGPDIAERVLTAMNDAA